MTASPVLLEPTLVTPGLGPVSAAGDTLVIREWTDSEPSYLHIHHCDDEAWHVLEGYFRFRFEHGEVDALAGTTVFVPAGLAHTWGRNKICFQTHANAVRSKNGGRLTTRKTPAIAAYSLNLGV